MRIKYAVISERGKREINQDAVFAAQYDQYAVFLIADGMGGHSNGEVASAAIADAIHEWWETVLTYDEIPPLSLVMQQCSDALERVNKELFYEYAQNGVMVGSTVILLIIWKDEFFAFSLGDSHLYRREKWKLKTVTEDDVWQNIPEVLQNMTEEQIRQDSRYEKLVSAIGAFENIKLHEYRGYLKSKETFLLCSDGIYKYCPERKMEKIICRILPSDPEIMLKGLQKKVLRNGTDDNYSAILCLVSDEQ